MAALLRHGARMVGGSAVQRTKAAFTTPAAAAEERRLLNTEHARPGPRKGREACLREIQERKEDLYDLISLVEETFMPKSYQNRQLLKFLSAQVKPRPDDDEWLSVLAGGKEVSPDR